MSEGLGNDIRPATADRRIRAWSLPPGSAARRARAVLREVLGAAGVGGGALGDAELAVAELAANAEAHGREPYELRIVCDARRPVWCEIVDGRDGLDTVTARLARPGADDDPAGPLREHGRGLLLVRHLTHGRCDAYPTLYTRDGPPAKAVGFALPDVPARLPPAPSPEPGRAAPTLRLPDTGTGPDGRSGTSLRIAADHLAKLRPEPETRRLASRPVVPHGRPPCLRVTALQAPARTETVLAAPDAAGGWAYWFAWPQRIAPVTRLADAADRIARVLSAPPGEPVTGE